MRITKENSIGVIIDIQEKLAPHMYNLDELVKNTNILIQGLKTLEIPLLVTQQYTKGLGPTLTTVFDNLAPLQPIEKICFSCTDEPDFLSQLENSHKKFVIISGIESHVCVAQTAIDLIEKGFQPVVIEDCTSSRKPNDKKIGIDRIKSEGAIISTYESILFELCRFAGNDAFKTISKLVK